MKFATKRWRVAAIAFTTAALSATAILLSGVQAARAQDPTDTVTKAPNRPFSLKVGEWVPSNGAVREDLGYSFLTFGAGYDIKTTKTAKPNAYEIFVDYFKKPKTSDGVRNQADLLGVGLSDRIYLTPRSADYQYYIGAGVGAYHVRVSSSEIGGSVNEYKTNVGGKFLAGAELSGGIFLEGEYAFVPEPKVEGNRVKLSGTQIRLGYRF